MQKKIIALAVAGLVSGGAFAQSNVTVYGVLDTGFASYSGTYSHAGVYKVGTATQKTFNGIQGGNSSSNRLGFRGEEALGNGLSATFNIETNLSSDGGAAAGTAGTTGLDTGGARMMTVGLQNKNWGSVKFGRQYTPFFDTVAAVDPFGATGIASAVIIHPAGMEGIARSSSSAKYNGQFGAFSVGFLYGFGEDNSTAAGGNTSIWSANLIYANGPFVAGLAHINVQDPANINAALAADDDRLSSTVLGGMYDFGMVKLHAAYNTFKSSGTTLAAAQVDHGDWHLGLSIPRGAHTFKVVYNKANDKSARNLDANHWGLGYQYDLSKRTAFYGTYAKVNNNNGAGYSINRPNGAGVQGGTNVAPAGANGTYTSGIVLGLKHSF
jgi:GBP family porin